MQALNDTLLQQFQNILVNLFQQARDDMIGILLQSTSLQQQQLGKKLTEIADEELLEFALRNQTPAISEQILSMKRIDAALNNMQISMYGLCADCEEQINIQRLHADPRSQRCLPCENKYQKQKYNDYKL